MNINVYDLELSSGLIDMAPKMQTARGEKHI